MEFVITRVITYALLFILAYATTNFLSYIAKVVVRTLIIDGLLITIRFLVDNSFYTVNPLFNSFYYSIIVFSLNILFFVINLYCLFLIYKYYKRNRQNSKNNLEKSKNINIKKIEK